MPRPLAKVVVDGQDITSRLSGLLRSLTVTDNAGTQSDQVQLELVDDGIAIPRTGAMISVSLGYAETGLALMGIYTVDEVTCKGGSSGRTMSISGRAVDVREKPKGRGTSCHENKTLAEILQDEAGQAGLSIDVGPEYKSMQIPFLPRSRESFIHLGTRLAKQYDATFKVTGGKAVFVKRGSGKSPSGKPLPTIMAAAGHNLLSWSMKPDIGRARWGAAKARWYDSEKDELKDVSAGGGEGPDLELPETYASEGEAKNAAKAKKDEQDRAKGGGTVEIEGNPAATAEALCMISGARPGVDGMWLIKSATHSLSSSGYKTSLTLELPNSQA